MLEVSLGSDDGLLVGAKLEVYRGSKWLARVEILRTETDRSVAKIIPGFQKGPIQKDDDVATRFKKRPCCKIQRPLKHNAASC